MLDLTNKMSSFSSSSSTGHVRSNTVIVKVIGSDCCTTLNQFLALTHPDSSPLKNKLCAVLTKEQKTLDMLKNENQQLQKMI